MEDFNLQKYIDDYSGITRIQRLECYKLNNKKESKKTALLIIKEILKGINTQLYQNTMSRFQKEFKGDPDFKFDVSWIEKTEKTAKKKKEQLELELNSYRTNMVKESVRTSFNALGEFYLSRGDLQNSLTNFGSTRDYNVSANHHIEMYLNIIKVAILMNNYSLASQYISRAEETLRMEPNAYEKKEKKIVYSKLRTASALCDLDIKDYQMLVRKLTREVDITIGLTFNEIITAKDIAYYAGLCALASLQRDDLKFWCINNPIFKNFLENVPIIKSLIENFYNSKYTEALSILCSITNYLNNDIYFSKHLGNITSDIRSKALKQYCLPFTSVDLKKMAKVFNTKTELLEKELEQLIVDKEINGKIDSHNKILYSKVAEKRDIAFKNVVDFGKNFEKSVKFNLLRMNMMKHKGFCIKSNKKSGGLFNNKAHGGFM